MCDTCTIDLPEERMFNLCYANNDTSTPPSPTISRASFERYKNNSTRVAHLLDSSPVRSPNYELVQRLEKLTSKYHTSVPMIISSWLKGDAYNLRLSDADVHFLNESVMAA
ncbi:hypothetical protein OGAPHI_006066 [Ogataea philodendri]|uniref:Uncharacterized protein n=1 Tax=Ogataea philodendri TaxID=1378263 RepID=A0A9P8NZ51_9ASCO|nr:uncharacterized protein OGAPHI_006066 [Ogataea philodendri]KAH3661887.1 hypothetical protein OGAPHI_006066 [Ogataea philodendri]